MNRCSKGHPMTKRNVFLHDGYEKCRTCRNEAQRALRARKAALVPRCPACGQRVKEAK